MGPLEFLQICIYHNKKSNATDIHAFSSCVVAIFATEVTLVFIVIAALSVRFHQDNHTVKFSCQHMPDFRARLVYFLSRSFSLQ